MTGCLFNFKPLRRFREAVLREMTQLERRAFILRSQPLRFYVGGLLLTVATWSMRYVLILFVVWGIYAPADKLLVFMRGAALTLASLGMPTPGGSGGIEGLYVLFFSGLIPTATVAPTLLVWRLLGYYAFIAVGLVLTTRYLGRRLTSCVPSPNLSPAQKEFVIDSLLVAPDVTACVAHACGSDYDRGGYDYLTPPHRICDYDQLSNPCPHIALSFYRYTGTCPGRRHERRR